MRAIVALLLALVVWNTVEEKVDDGFMKSGSIGRSISVLIIIIALLYTILRLILH